ncbi:PREDICTED: uncharacterized protein LOC108368336 [Rhagoletis zephyria]|uniref:uncharacterized protein LOC108368336 n=1 Tax=Rhagoletis zephyria TaxID=28612 RepID=UPI0008116023|nr:PREDICTED: uncharacterized protein LOC108368336 [Rhagoletis zephyria]
MAASIYATPPPDLSSEDTALSDVSNASSLNNRSSNNSNSNTTNSNTNYNNSTTTSNNNTTRTNPVANKQKRTISEVLAGSGGGGGGGASQVDQQSPKRCTSASPKASNGGITTSAAITVEEAIDSTTIRDEGVIDDDADMSTTSSPTESASAATIAAVAAAANAAAMQLQLLEALNDAAKKRRKQNNPSRLGAQAAAAAAAAALQLNEANEGALINATAEAIIADKPPPTTLPIDYEEKLSKMFLPKSMEQLKETFEMLQQQRQQQFGDISPDAGEQKATELQASADERQNPYHTFCKTCGENFETEFKLGLHMLQEHQNDELEQGSIGGAVEDAQQKAEHMPYDMLGAVNVKIERPDYDNSTSPPAAASSNKNESSTPSLLTNGKEPWLHAMPGMGFPFPPEAAAAAALSASGYLPLLGMPGFPSVDGLNRPPLRIFNPEAYCDLCNKEFCNKYFLKTHKANKHGIYDPAVSGSGECGNSAAAGGNMNAMTQMLQLQMQQQQQQQQQQQHSMQQLQQKQQLALEEVQQKQLSAQAANSATAQQLTPPAPPPVYCDICSKRFTNVFAMRRHRAKSHEQLPRNSPGGEQPIPTPPPQPPQSTAKSDTAAAAQNETKHESVVTDAASSGAGKQFQMPDGFRQDFTLEQEEVAFTPQPRKLSPQSQQQARDANFAHDKLRRLGVLNPEAFCEICCKEYCNKYFLRTHKWKRHGIFVPPDDVKDEQLQLTQKMSWPFMGLPGMPLNLMMAGDKALMAQRMFAAANAATSATANASVDETNQHMAKRIKLEQVDEDISRGNDENQENNPEAVAGLQNLQKLQSMIQQLNDLNGKRSLGCHLCGREMENQYTLQAHIVTEHAGLFDSSASTLPLNFQQHLFQQQQQLQAQQALKLSPSGSPGVLPPLNEMRCNQCDRDFANIQEFKQHIAEVHLLSGSPLREGFVTPERPINPSAAATNSRPPYTITPTSSYCEICNKELCNKYFMKTHMQRMHGIEIENGAQIGGVVCNICNKELCSKYFLRVHKHNTHGIVEEGAPLPQPRQNGLSFEAQQQQQQPPPQSQQQPQLPAAENDYSRGLNQSPFGSGNSGDSKSDYANYTEVCVICTRRFRSAKWLRGHLLSDHGSAGIEKLREIEQQYGPLCKSTSPTLKIPNGSGSSGPSGGGGGGSTSTGSSASTAAGLLPNPTNLAQALQNLNAQHLLGNMPKNMLPGMFGVVAEQALQSPRLQEYQCTMCPFTTPYYAFLFIHERSHSLLGGGGGVAGDLSAAAAHDQFMGSTGTKDEAGGRDEVKSKADSTSSSALVADDKFQVAPLMPTNSAAVQAAESSRVEPTNLSTRITTSTGSSSGSKCKSSKENAVAQRSVKHADAKENHKEATASRAAVNAKGDRTRTIATSPILTAANMPAQQDALNQLAEKSGKIASYAVPKDSAAVVDMADGEPQMQAFVLELQQQRREKDAMAADAENGDAEEQCNRFVPAIVYLPVRKRISGPVTVSFNLTPA